jgi:hypothetical protein
MPYDTITSEKEWTTTIFDMEWGDDKRKTAYKFIWKRQ